jgi:hypothetical protein
MWRLVPVWVILLFALSSPAAAQADDRRLVFYQRPRAPLSMGLTVAPSSTTAPPTHWMEGAIIGTLAVGALLGYVTYEFCHGLNEDSSTDCSAQAVGGGLVGGALGFVVGGLIGGAFPKD